MNRQPVASSNIKSMGYDDRSKTLEVEFNNGAIYQYHQVPGEVFAQLLSAPSMGSHFHRHIKTAYDCKPL